MNKEAIWNIFKKTGNIEAYMLYRDLTKQEIGREPYPDEEEKEKDSKDN